MPGGASQLAPDPVFTTWPSPCSTSRGTKVRMPWTTPQRLTPSTQRHSSAEVTQLRPNVPATPALLHTRWTAPNWRTTWSARASTAAASATSVGTPTTSAPVAASEPTAASSAASSTSTRATRMPSATRRSASASPIPLAAPVTTATRPFNSRIVSDHPF